ncbi:MAG: hypothetical protein OJF59_002042 [Cytophagales bacterium]|jgi:hypothetical protein|nr:MAG: hypothetical protein OJF59_002042 [Cytophagales bacterium]
MRGDKDVSAGVSFDQFFECPVSGHQVSLMK